MAKIPEDFKEKYNSYLEGYLTLEDICTNYNTYPKQIYRWRDKVGLLPKYKNSEQECKRKDTVGVSKEKFLEDYNDYLLGKTSIRVLTNKYNLTSSGSLYHYIRKWNLPKKSQLVQLVELCEGTSDIRTCSIGNYHVTIKVKKLEH